MQCCLCLDMRLFFCLSCLSCLSSLLVFVFFVCLFVFLCSVVCALIMRLFFCLSCLSCLSSLLVFVFFVCLFVFLCSVVCALLVCSGEADDKSPRGSPETAVNSQRRNRETTWNRFLPERVSLFQCSLSFYPFRKRCVLFSLYYVKHSGEKKPCTRRFSWTRANHSLVKECNRCTRFTLLIKGQFPPPKNDNRSTKDVEITP